MKPKPPAPSPKPNETTHERIIRLINGHHPGNLVDPKAALEALNNTTK